MKTLQAKLRDQMEREGYEFPKPVDDTEHVEDNDSAVKELLECRTYIMAYDPLLCDGMDLYVSGKFPDGHVAKWIKDEVSK